MGEVTFKVSKGGRFFRGKGERNKPRFSLIYKSRPQSSLFFFSFFVANPNSQRL